MGELMSGHNSLLAPICSLVIIGGLLFFAERVHSWYDIRKETRWILSSTAASLILLFLGVDIIGKDEGLLLRCLWVPIFYYGLKYILKLMVYMLDDNIK